MRYLMSALFALALVAGSHPGADAATDPVKVVYCGVVGENSITTGEGSGPRTYVLRVTNGPGGGLFIFAVAASLALPTIGVYICGQFTQGVPMNGLVAVLGPGDAGYVAPVGPPAAGALPSTSTQPPTGMTSGFELLLFGLIALAAIGRPVARSAACLVRTAGRLV